MFSGQVISGTTENAVSRLRTALDQADGVVIGAGAGLSTSAGFRYSGERFDRWFGDFASAYGIADMYSGGFYPFPTPEITWAWWSRHIWVNRYMNPPIPVYERLLDLVRDKDYFVITTNVDHCFQKAGFDKNRMFYTQGDYGLWQCSRPCHQSTYDNRDAVRTMLLAQGYVIGEDGDLTLPQGVTAKMAIPTELIPRCPRCGRPMSMNLRSDDTFVEDEGWHAHARLYADYLEAHRGGRVLFMELGVGANTPTIVKFPFLRMTQEWKAATYACLNYGEAFVPVEIQNRAICIDDDIGTALAQVAQGE